MQLASRSARHGSRRVSSLWRVVSLTIVLLLLAGGISATGISAQDDEEAPAAPSVAEAAQPGGELPGNPEVQLVQVAGGLVDPVNVTHAGDGSGRIFVVERVGTVRIIQDGEVMEEPFLDISNAVKTDFLEQGLLGLAFHPDYAENGRFYVYYSSYLENGAHTLEEYTVSEDDENAADPQSAQTLFSFPDPYVNHNGGTIKFGPDGYLYVAIGDGGLAGDPYENAQDLDNLMGKILRIDVDGGEPYGIPDDNPFAEAGQRLSGPARGEPAYYHPEGSPEIWSYGLRNPWQFSFDRENGDLYIADVGQNYWEEINVAPAGEGGQNYGWDFLEGTHCYPAEETECQLVGVPPVAEYDHGDGSCSITGIGVYRGEESTSLDGIYFNSDFCSGDVWGLTRDENDEWAYAKLLDTSLLVTGSGEDEAGELYVTSCSCVFGRDYDPYTQSDGKLWQLVAADQVEDDAEVAPTAEPEEATEDEEGATPSAVEDEGVADGTPEATPEARVPVAFRD